MNHYHRAILISFLFSVIPGFILWLPMMPTVFQKDLYGIPIAGIGGMPVHFDLTDVDGHMVSSASMRGEYVFIVPELDECPEKCPESLNQLVSFVESSNRDDLNLLYVQSGEQVSHESRQLRNSINHSWLKRIPDNQLGLLNLSDQLGDSTGSILAQVHALNSPTTVYLLDRTGRPRLRYSYAVIEPDRLHRDLAALESRTF